MNDVQSRKGVERIYGGIIYYVESHEEKISGSSPFFDYSRGEPGNEAIGRMLSSTLLI